MQYQLNQNFAVKGGHYCHVSVSSAIRYSSHQFIEDNDAVRSNRLMTLSLEGLAGMTESSLGGS